MSFIDVFNIANNDNFFDVLSRPTKKLYWKIIMELYTEINNVYERRVSKTVATQIIQMLVNDHNVNEVNIVAATPRDFLITLMSCGWITQKYEGELSDDYYSLTSFALDFIKMVVDSNTNRETPQTEDSVLRIRAIVKDILNKEENSDSYKYPYRSGISRINIILEQSFHNLNRNNIRLKEEAQMLLDTKNRDELYEKLIDYINNLNHGYLHSVYESFNITDLCRNELMELISMVQDNQDLQQRILLDMFERYAKDNRGEDELKEILNRELFEIQININTKYPEFKKKIDENVANALNSAISKIKILGEGANSQLSILNKLITEWAIVSDEGVLSLLEQNESFKNSFAKSVNFRRVKIYGEDSLAKQRNLDKEVVIEPVEMPEDTVFDFTTIYNKMLSVSKANEYVNEILEQNVEKYASDLTITENLISQLQTICLYTDDRDAEYSIELIENKIIKDGYEFNDFVIRRK